MPPYADEDIPDAVVQELRRLAHDVFTAREDNQYGADDSQTWRALKRLDDLS